MDPAAFPESRAADMNGVLSGYPKKEKGLNGFDKRHLLASRQTHRIYRSRQCRCSCFRRFRKIPGVTAIGFPIRLQHQRCCKRLAFDDAVEVFITPRTASGRIRKPSGSLLSYYPWQYDNETENGGPSANPSESFRLPVELMSTSSSPSFLCWEPSPGETEFPPTGFKTRRKSG